MMRFVSLSFLSTLLVVPVFAQQTQPVAGATISGNIICGDNNTPGRLARVMLKPAFVDEDAVARHIENITQVRAQVNKANPNLPAPQPRSAEEQASERNKATREVSMASERGNSISADFNGHYVLTGIPPGTYYVHALLEGYVDPLDQFNFDELNSADPETAKRINQLAPRITVLGSEEQRIDIRLERGASITGRILYDDGSPARGWLVSVLPKSSLQLKPNDPNAPYGFVSAVGVNAPPPRSDDLGNFRVNGLAAGDYAIRAVLYYSDPKAKSIGSSGSLNMTLYSGDTFHMSEAKTFSLTSGQTRSGTDITVPLNKLHNIHGSVVAKSDGHSLNGGTVSLSSKDDPAFNPYSNLMPDGSFTLYSIPAGEYLVMVKSASDIGPVTISTPVGPRISMQTLRVYGPVTTTVILNDVDLTGVTLTVPDLKAAASN